MSKFDAEINDFKFVLREEGTTAAFRKTGRVIKKKLVDRFRSSSKNDGNKMDNSCYDVLFVNGCDYCVPHPIRYRIDHQMEQAMAAGYSVKRIEAGEFCKESLRHARTIIIFRCALTDQIAETITLAKKLNKRVIYDIDDLVIDTQYTDLIPYLDTMSEQDRAQYDEGVRLMGATLKMCDAAITTTEALATELRKYVPRVYVNRNVASEAMVDRSEVENFRRFTLPYLPDDQISKKDMKLRVNVITKARQKDKSGVVKIGYFSGSITHNDDFALIMPSIVDVMNKRKNVVLALTGEIDIPDELRAFRDRVEFLPFCEWKRLPHLIASCDINLAPLADTLFNRAKSENKWTEASLVKVPTIASNVGAFAEMIKDRETGILCSNREEWTNALFTLIDNCDLRQEIAENAYTFCKDNCTTIATCKVIHEILLKEKIKNFVFFLPSLDLSGGVLVALKHAFFLQEAGFDVMLASDLSSELWVEFDGRSFPHLNRESLPGTPCSTKLECDIDVGVATFWETLDFAKRYHKIKEVKYLVQDYEVEFYDHGTFQRVASSQTYFDHMGEVDYITISKWCSDWLKNRCGQDVKYAPNGIDLNIFHQRDEGCYSNNKVRILIEGDCTSRRKNVDEAFRIASHLDHEKFEIWYLTSTGFTNDFYKFDKLLSGVPHDEVADIMRQCDILLKTSIFESFSYPPLEMMATGGLVLVLKNPGNAEYVQDGYNCLTYERGDDVGAANTIEKLCADKDLQEKLIAGGLETANKYDWNLVKKDVLGLYE